jgi:N-acetyl-gamma-glutamyl-phosphate reductase
MAAYKVLSHQHVPEIRRFLGLFGPVPELLMVPLSAPVDRGIFAVCFVPLDGGALAAPLFADAAAQSPRTRLRPQTPQLRLVRGTGFCDLTVHQEGTTAVVLSAIDNLGMGAAAQAVACLERALGITSVAAVPACTP